MIENEKKILISHRQFIPGISLSTPLQMNSGLKLLRLQVTSVCQSCILYNLFGKASAAQVYTTQTLFSGGFFFSAVQAWSYASVDQK